MFVQGEKNKKKKRVSSEGSLHVQCSIFKRAFSGVAFRPSNLGLFGSSLQPGAREKKKKNRKYIFWKKEIIISLTFHGIDVISQNFAAQ